jgi:hypothetical protein
MSPAYIHPSKNCPPALEACLFLHFPNKRKRLKIGEMLLFLEAKSRNLYFSDFCQTGNFLTKSKRHASLAGGPFLADYHRDVFILPKRLWHCLR